MARRPVGAVEARSPSRAASVGHGDPSRRSALRAIIETVAATQISPMLAVSDAAAAIDFYKAAFGAVERWRIDDGGRVVAGLSIGGADLYLASANPPSTRGPDDVGGTTVRIELFVDDPQATYEQAIAAGARPGDPPVERSHTLVDGSTLRMLQGGVADPFGHAWLIGRFLEQQ